MADEKETKSEDDKEQKYDSFHMELSDSLSLDPKPEVSDLALRDSSQLFCSSAQKSHASANLLNDSESYWQSEGSGVHQLTLEFNCFVSLTRIVIWSYTGSKDNIPTWIEIKAGTGTKDPKESKEEVKHSGSGGVGIVDDIGQEIVIAELGKPKAGKDETTIRWKDLDSTSNCKEIKIDLGSQNIQSLKTPVRTLVFMLESPSSGSIALGRIQTFGFLAPQVIGPWSELREKPLDLKSAFLRSVHGADDDSSLSLLGWMNYGSLFDIWVDDELLKALSAVGLYYHREDEGKSPVSDEVSGREHSSSLSQSLTSREEVSSKVDHASMIIDAIDRHPAGSTPLILSLCGFFQDPHVSSRALEKRKDVVLNFVLPLLVSGNDEYQKAALEMVQLIVKTDQSVLTPIVKHVMDLLPKLDEWELVPDPESADAQREKEKPKEDKESKASAISQRREEILDLLVSLLEAQQIDVFSDADKKTKKEQKVKKGKDEEKEKVTQAEQLQTLLKQIADRAFCVRAGSLTSLLRVLTLYLDIAEQLGKSGSREDHDIQKARIELINAAVALFEQNHPAVGTKSKIIGGGTDGKVEFTTCGVTGHKGPTKEQGAKAYKDTPLEDLVTFKEGIQYWEVPSSGVFKIEAYGSRGASGDKRQTPGKGAKMVGEFELTAGETLKILVGQEGTSDGSNGGGGGGTFVAHQSDTPMVVAGGGGGLRHEAAQAGFGGLTSTFGGTSTGGSSSGSQSAKTADERMGGKISSSSYGSSGAGFEGDGLQDSSSVIAKSFLHGGEGGHMSSNASSAQGGFGGGGSGCGSSGGGGAGGYSGGDSGWVAGGGGSYNDGDNPDNAGNFNDSPGRVVIHIGSSVVQHELVVQSTSHKNRKDWCLRSIDEVFDQNNWSTHFPEEKTEPRGMVVLALKSDGTRDRPLRQFDTSETSLDLEASKKFIDFIKTVDDGCFVLICTVSDFTSKLTNDARRVVETLGSSLVTTAGTRDAFAMVTQKGKPEKCLEKLVPRGDGDSAFAMEKGVLFAQRSVPKAIGEMMSRMASSLMQGVLLEAMHVFDQVRSGQKTDGNALSSVRRLANVMTLYGTPGKMLFSSYLKGRAALFHSLQAAAWLGKLKSKDVTALELPKKLLQQQNNEKRISKSLRLSTESLITLTDLVSLSWLDCLGNSGTDLFKEGISALLEEYLREVSLYNEQRRKIRLFIHLLCQNKASNQKLVESWGNMVESSVSSLLSDATTRGSPEMRSPEHFVNNLNELLFKYRNISNTELFPDRAKFMSAIDDGFQAAFGKLYEDVAVEVAEIFAMYLDSLADRSHHAGTDKRLGIHEREEKIQSVVNILLVIRQQQDIWYFYERRLKNRLLRYRYFSLELEARLLEQVDLNNCSLVSKTMINEVMDSRQLQRRFDAWAVKKFDSQLELGDTTGDDVMSDETIKFVYQKSFSPNIISSIIWPIDLPDDGVEEPAIQLPEVLHSVCDSFGQYYSSIYSHRKLEWDHKEGTATVTVQLKVGPVDFNVTTLQMCIVLLFTNVDELSYQEVTSHVGSSDIRVSSALKSLATDGQDVLTCLTPEEIGYDGIYKSDSKFCLNLSYEPPPGVKEVTVHGIDISTGSSAGDKAALYAWRREVIDSMVMNIVKKMTREIEEDTKETEKKDDKEAKEDNDTAGDKGKLDGELKFTTCGKTGWEGPTQEDVDKEYSSANELHKKIKISKRGIQEWTVPFGGTYRISAFGASGTSATKTYRPGNGAKMIGDFELKADQKLRIIVGQEGTSNGGNGGGGGGTFVVDEDDAPLIVAGGGGGCRSECGQDGCGGLITTFGGKGSGTSKTGTIGTKDSDEKMGGAISSSYGSSGAGFEGDGKQDSSSVIAKSFLHGGDGGHMSSGTNSEGGFGGGGSGCGSTGGGGGGGYSGGDSGWIAGGGGSFNIGENSDNEADSNSGPGKVIISQGKKLSVIKVDDVISQVKEKCENRFRVKTEDIRTQIMLLIKRSHVFETRTGKGEQALRYIDDPEELLHDGEEKEEKEEKTETPSTKESKILIEKLPDQPPLMSMLQRQLSTSEHIRDPTFHPSTPAARCLTEDEVENAMNSEVVKVSECLELPKNEVEALLYKTEWNATLLIQRYILAPSTTRKNIGLSPLGYNTPAPSGDKSEKVTCVTCLDEISARDMLSLWCGHGYCKKCWKNWFEAQLSDNKALKTICMDPKCTALLTADILLELLDTETYLKYRRLLVKGYVLESDVMAWCQNPRCDAVVYTESAESLTHCVLCHHRFMCAHCEFAAHSPSSCQNMSDWDGVGGFIDSNEEDRSNRRLMASTTKGCPKCHARIEKNEGCPHMTCTHCQHQFCWKCLGDYPNCFCKLSKADRMKRHADAADRGGSAASFEELNNMCLRHSVRGKNIKAMLVLADMYDNSITDDLEMGNDGMIAYLQLVPSAAHLLIQCRQVLTHSCVMKFFARKFKGKTGGKAEVRDTYQLFEFLFDELERRTESLQSAFEKQESIQRMISNKRTHSHFRTVRTQIESLSRQLERFIVVAREIS